jgi:hypothetical protein
VRVFEDKRYRYDGYSRLTEKRIGKHTIPPRASRKANQSPIENTLNQAYRLTLM